MRILAKLTIFLATVPALFATGLDWKTTKIELSADFGQQETIARYPFENTSDTTIEITNTQASCGCTVPSLAKKIYKPGESGELIAQFDIGSRTGHQHKEITVTAKQGEADISYKLVLEVDIPQAVKIKRRAMIWKVGSELKTQTGTIEIHPDLSFPIEGFKHINLKDDSKFDITVTAADSPNTYDISATPKIVDKRATEYINLTSSGDTDNHLDRYRIALYIR